MDKKKRIVTGVLRCNANGRFGFVRVGDEDREIFIPHDGLGAAYDRDTVQVRIDINDNEHGHQEGHIERVISRGNTQLVGVISGRKREHFRMSPDRRAFFSRLRIPPGDMNGARQGDRVLAEITGYNKKNKPMGRVLATLGRADDISGCIDGIIAEAGLPCVFDEKTINASRRCRKSVSEKEAEARENLRDKIIFTIDGDDSRDFDDAVSLERNDNGNMILGVHIADVTHYVKEGSALDNEAFRRGTSVYFPDRVIPMLPEALSNGICSLNPDVDRLTLSVFMEIDKTGSIVSSRMSETVIHSFARMTYNNVNRILDGDKKLRDEYKTIAPILDDMAELSDIMEQKRTERGAIDFNFPETKIICDKRGEPSDVFQYERGRGERLIESFMLAANETIAETAYWAELPFVYRVHDAPDNAKLAAFNDFIKNFGLSFKGKTDSDSIHPKDIEMILDQVKGRPEELMISQMALRSLMKACYRDTNSGHFGLAARYYCHFTSPIRRYPDLMIHRILKEFMSGKLTKKRQERYEPVVSAAAVQSSARELAAESAEREVEDLLKTAYMRRFLGESFDAIISSVTSFGMFARLENSCEGLIRCENMTEDYFIYDELQHTLRGERCGRVYSIGDSIRITVAACDIVQRRIDFILEDDYLMFGLPEKRKRKYR